MSKLSHSHQPTMDAIDARRAAEDGVDVPTHGLEAAIDVMQATFGKLEAVLREKIEVGEALNALLVKQSASRLDIITELEIDGQKSFDRIAELETLLGDTLRFLKSHEREVNRGGYGEPPEPEPNDAMMLANSIRAALADTRASKAEGV